MPPIDEGQIFTTLLEFKQALRDWAIERNFTPHILDSDSHRVRAGCRSSPDCPFRIRANYSEKRGNARVTTCEDVHNCVSTSGHLVSQTIKRPEAGKLKFLVEAVPKIIDMEEPITTTIIIDAVKRKYGQNLPLRQAQKVKRALGGKPHGPCRECRRMGHSKKTCPVLFPGGYNFDASSRTDAMDNDDSGMQLDSGGENPSGPEHQCTRCFQTGHTYDQCSSDHGPSAPNEAAGFGSEQRNLAGQHRDEVIIDPNLRNNFSRPGLSGAQVQPSNREPQPPNLQPNQFAISQTEQPTRTPQDTRVEAARLMQHAARLMQEAAKLNFEAARLTASVANS